MENYKTAHILLFLLIFCCFTVKGQVIKTSAANLIAGKEKPVVGKPMPDFTLDNITHYKSTKASLKDLRGKWLILDFWYTGCVVCIKSFPHLTELQNEFKSDIQFLLVGVNDKGNKGIENLFENLRVKQRLELSIAYDSTLYQSWGPFSFPQIYIIDPNGVLRAITGGRDMTSEKLRQLLIGGKPSFYPKASKVPELGINNISPKDSDSLVLFESILKIFDNDAFSIPPIEYQLNLTSYVRKGYKAFGVSLPFLYNIAYFGKHHWSYGDSLYSKVYRKPILEMKDTSLFEWSDRIIKGLYNYSLTIPEKEISKEVLMKRMQQDLYNYWEYKVKIEIRNMPVYKLILLNGDTTSLSTNGNKFYFSDWGSSSGGAAGFTATNLKWADFIILIQRYLTDFRWIPLFDETGIRGNIDISIDALLSDFQGVKKELQKNGLDIVLSEKQFKVLVISNSKE